MTKRKCDGYLDEIQERMNGDVLKAMVEVIAQRVMEEELAHHLGAERHERTEERPGPSQRVQGAWSKDACGRVGAASASGARG